MRLQLKVVALAGLLLASAPGLSATLQTENFDSSAAAASNGWALYNGETGWGWQNTNDAGGNAGEARASTYTAGTQRWYSDTDLGGTLSFSEDWYATGRIDFTENSASDGGMFFGFFNRNTSLAAGNQTVAGLLLVNGQLTLRFERRPNTEFFETADFGLWVNDDRTFTLSYDADGGGSGIGRLTLSLTRVADNTTITKSLDINQSLVSGAVLDSFGFYAMDFAPGRYTPFGWAADNLRYGPGQVPDPTAMLNELLADVRGVGPGKTLANKVKLAQTYYAAGDIPATCAALTDFVSTVQMYSTGRKPKISSAVATQLIADAQAIMTAIGCG